MPAAALLLLLLLRAVLAAAARDTITPSTPLSGNETLVSAGGTFTLGFFSPSGSANLYVGIWYSSIPVQTIVWTANRARPAAAKNGSFSIAGNGTLAVADGTGAVLWSASPELPPGSSPAAQLLDNGNLVIKSGSATAWQSFEHPTDTLLADMLFGANRTSGVDTTTTCWSSDSDPSPGAVTMSMVLTAAPELVLYSGKQKLWRTGPWDGVDFSGVPATYKDFSFQFTAAAGAAAFYSFHTLDSKLVSTMRLNRSGVVNRWLWLNNQWNVYWYAPKDPCDYYNVCGGHGVCDADASPMCSCMPGFRPANPANWHDGCARKTPVGCATDGFVKLGGAKTPDTARTASDRTMTLEECRAACLANCSCTAYAAVSVVAAVPGCVMWFGELDDVRVFPAMGGQDLYVRLAAADLGSSSDDSGGTPVGLTVGLSIAGVAVLAGAGGFFAWRRMKRRRRRQRTLPSSFHKEAHVVDVAGDADGGDDVDLPLLDIETVAGATDGFSFGNKLGEGGFGPVYKGKFSDGQEIAVKRLARSSLQGVKEFKNEVKLIAKLQHRNLVRLLGCCIHGEEMMLVYEFMANRSLDALIFDKEKNKHLDWGMRCQIVLGIARGLLYLHEDSRLRIIHRDLKASNILLDKEMNPKISDFGMARIFGGDEKEFNTRRVVGTYGYMAPEYAMNGTYSVKSDVFSFGVLVLEIVSGRRNRAVFLDFDHQGLLGKAWSLWQEGKALQLVDDSLGFDYSSEEVLRCIKLALLCVQEQPDDRPGMSVALVMLGRDAAAMPEPRKPGFAADAAVMRGPAETSESAYGKQESSSSAAISEVWITQIQGR